MDAEQPDRDDDRQGRAGVDAENARAGQRIARHALDHRAREAEADPREQARDRARETEVPDDAVGVGAGELARRGVHVVRSEEAIADHHRDDNDAGEHGQRGQETNRAVHLTRSGWMILAISSVVCAPRTPAE